jgi:hypothetical protein
LLRLRLSNCTRNQWRGDMIKRGFANYNARTGKWEWGEQARH